VTLGVRAFSVVVAALFASPPALADSPDEDVQLLCELDIKNISPRGPEPTAHELIPVEVTRINNELSVKARGQHLAFTMSMEDRFVTDYSNNLDWTLLGGRDAFARNAMQRILIVRSALQRFPKHHGNFYDWIETHRESPGKLNSLNTGYGHVR
jgi:hypothetical protein